MGVEHFGVEFDPQPQCLSGDGCHRQRVVVVLPAGEGADGQPAVAQQRCGVHRVVLVDEQGVEHLLVADQVMNFGQRQVFVLEGVVVLTLELLQQIGHGVRGGDPGSHRHRVDQQTHHEVRTGHIGGPPRHCGTEGHIAASGQHHQHLGPAGLQHRADRCLPAAGQFGERVGDRRGHLERFDTTRTQRQAARWTDESRRVETVEHCAPRRLRRTPILTGQPGDEPAIGRRFG